TFDTSSRRGFGRCHSPPCGGPFAARWPMLRSLLLSLVLVTILPPAPASAADASATQLCVAVEGARDEVTPDELTAGIVDGSMVITAVRSCTHPPRPGQDAEDPGELEDPGPTATTK